jgi:hypothetical protein
MHPGDSLFERQIGRVLMAGAIAVALAAGLWWWRKHGGRRDRGGRERSS